MTPIARHVRVTGQVQGVFFRQWTKEQARALRVSGWVRNCPDGSVEARIEGDGDAVGQLIDRLREGPPTARVDGLVITDVEIEGAAGFDVRR